jgi:tubulin-like protein CetZ
MRLLVIGVGDGGSRLAAEFARLDERSRRERGAQIITAAYAVNTDQEFLKALAKNKPRLLSTVPVRTNDIQVTTPERAAQLMREESGRIIAAMRPNEFYDTDGILFITSAAGNLGSGGVPVIAQNLKERHIGKPIHAMVILPYDSESNNPQVIHNTAVSLKSLHQTTDAIFVFENDRFKLDAVSTKPEDLDKMNEQMVSYFYDLLCSTGEAGARHRGVKALGVGDIDQTLIGWTAIGIGASDFPMTRSLLRREKTFKEKGSETRKIMEAMTSALGRVSVGCKMEDASKALYLLSIPEGGINIDMAKVLGNHLREITHDAEIRGGDFYGTRDKAQVTLVMSGLNYIDVVKNYYDKAVTAAKDSVQEKTATE